MDQNHNQNQNQNQEGTTLFNPATDQESLTIHPRIVFLPGNRIALEVPAEATPEEQDRVDFATGVFEALQKSVGCIPAGEVTKTLGMVAGLPAVPLEKIPVSAFEDEPRRVWINAVDLLNRVQCGAIAERAGSEIVKALKAAPYGSTVRFEFTKS